jgi:hypothetical protein
LPLFTELPRRVVPGNWASGIRGSRKLKLRKGIKKGSGRGPEPEDRALYRGE